MEGLAELLRAQAGVVSRRQLLELGSEDDVRRLLRRQELTPVFPGVYVDHSGALTWLQRAWAGVHHAWPAALAGRSAVRAHERRNLHDTTVDDDIEIAIDRHRKIVAPDGYVVSRLVRFGARVQWNAAPPRLRYDEAVLDLAMEEPDDIDAVAVLAQACGSRRTTADRLLAALAARPRASRRAWLEGVLRDIADGTHSVLEHGYLTKVERPHRIPTGRRQLSFRGADGRGFRDVDLPQAVVELDGALFHEGLAARDDDLERDLDVLVDGRPTARLGWGQVFRRSCQTAYKVSLFLQRHGWSGQPRACGDPDCVVRTGLR